MAEQALTVLQALCSHPVSKPQLTGLILVLP